FAVVKELLSLLLVQILCPLRKHLPKIHHPGDFDLAV
ncbi:hypothetical protein TCE0_022r06589, partial [Talaromyces pinophilus]